MTDTFPREPATATATLGLDVDPGPALEPTSATALATGNAGGALDAHGFDPAAYDWVPVRRQPRPDGWSEEKQRLFIATLADTGSVREAARAVGKSARSAYALRRAPEGGGFARAWTAAVRQGMNRLVDVCLERAMEGSQEAVYDREGRVLGLRTRYHDRMAMFLLRAHMPELFRDAHRADRARGEALPPPPEPVAQAALAIDPVPPADPHTLMSPDDLDAAVTVADILDGQLPHWRRDPDLVARQANAPSPDMHAAVHTRPNRVAPDLDPGPDDPDAVTDASPLGQQFERDLAAAKRVQRDGPQRKRARRRTKGAPSVT